MRKIGELKGKPIIEGNPNEIKKNQIHYEEKDGNITLSERKEDNTLSSVTSGSGNGDEVKEYYYKFKDEFLDTNIHDITIMDMPFLPFLDGMVVIDAIICPIYTYDEVYHSIGNSELDGSSVILNRIEATPYFKIIDSNIWAIAGYQDDHTIMYDAIIPRIGNIENRMLIKAADIFGGEEGAIELLQTINGIIQEITKEEYEAMITYKPE